MEITKLLQDCYGRNDSELCILYGVVHTIPPDQHIARALYKPYINSDKLYVVSKTTAEVYTAMYKKEVLIKEAHPERLIPRNYHITFDPIEGSYECVKLPTIFLWK